MIAYTDLAAPDDRVAGKGIERMAGNGFRSVAAYSSFNKFRMSGAIRRHRRETGNC